MGKSSIFRRVIKLRRVREENSRRIRLFRYLIRRQEELMIFIATLLLLFPHSTPSPRAVWTIPRSLHFWENIVLNTWDDDLWLENFRMNKATFSYLVEELRPHIARKNTQLRRCVSVEHRVAIVLWRLATNTDYRTLSALFGIGRSTVCSIVLETTQAIVNVLQRKHITIPSGQRLQDCLQRFSGRGFPQAVGAIDGSHIPIIAPSQHHQDYCNRKGFYSIILQGTVDSFGQFIDVVVGWPGSVHDARVFANSEICKKLETFSLFPAAVKIINGVPIPLMLLADPAYPLMENLMKPFSDNGRLSQEQFEFNKRLSQCRITVEHSFGRLKSRWRILSKKMDIYLENVPNVIMSCCILHNVVESFGNPFYEHWLLDEEVTQGQINVVSNGNGTSSSRKGAQVRLALMEHLSKT